MPELILDTHRKLTPLDHPDGSVTTGKLASLNYITLNGLTSDPSLTPGRIWFRSDLGELRWTPDGTTIYKIDPAPLPIKTWSETTPYYTVSPGYTSGSGTPYTAVVELNSPATNHKRVRETASGPYRYAYHFALKKNFKLATRFDVKAFIGAYHGYNATRANLLFTLTHQNNVNKTTRDNTVPWLHMSWGLSSLGYSNGSYGNPLTGYIVFTSPPSYSFSPANPGSVLYNMITQIPTTPTWILYGFDDSWTANWNQWASLSRSSEFRFRVATEPPKFEVLRQLDSICGCELLIARWDGEVRLWIKYDDTGMIISLGKNVEVTEVSKDSMTFSESLFDKAIREKDRVRSCLKILIRTDVSDLHKISNNWVLRIVDDYDKIVTIFGDSNWDGDKYGYHISNFTPP